MGLPRSVEASEAMRVQELLKPQRLRAFRNVLECRIPLGIKKSWHRREGKEFLSYRH
jgi:hypothetical protein